MPDLARLRALFTVDPVTGGIVWRARSPADFAALGLSNRTASRVARDWTAHKTGRAPQWRETPRGLICRADRAPVALVDICRALGVDVTQAARAARAAMTGQQDRAARALVLRLCALDSVGRIVWAQRTAKTAPKTTPEARARFNARWAGVPLNVRHGEISIQRHRIDHAQALEWLTSDNPQDRAPGAPDDADLLHLWQPLAKSADVPAPGLHPEYVQHCAAQGLDPAQTADHLRRVCAQCAQVPADTLAVLALAMLTQK